MLLATIYMKRMRFEQRDIIDLRTSVIGRSAKIASRSDRHFRIFEEAGYEIDFADLRSLGPSVQWRQGHKSRDWSSRSGWTCPESCLVNDVAWLAKQRRYDERASQSRKNINKDGHDLPLTFHKTS